MSTLSRLPSRCRPTAAALGLLVTLAGCASGPTIKSPRRRCRHLFRTGPWKIAVPKDGLPKDNWWSVFGDPALDAFEQQAATASPTLQAAVARRDQARALAGISRGDYFLKSRSMPMARAPAIRATAKSRRGCEYCVYD